MNLRPESILSHMNLPLSMLHTYVALLDVADLPHQEKEYLKAAQETCLTLLDLVSTTQSSAQGVHLDTLDMSPLLHGLVEKSQLLCPQKGIALILDNPYTHLPVKTDASLVESATLHLLYLAIRLSQPNTRIVAALLATQYYLTFSIDMTPDSPTAQACPTDLSDIQQLVAPLAGEVRAYQTEAKGLSLTLRLPFQEAPSARSNVIPLHSFTPKDIQVQLF